MRTHLRKGVSRLARNKFDVDERLETPFSFRHLRRSMVYVKKHMRKMLLALFLSAVSVVCSLLAPYLMKVAVDVAVPQKDVKMLLVITAALVVSMLLSVIFITWRSVLMAQVGQDIIYDIRQDLFVKLQQLPFSYYDSRPHGKILVRVVQYVNGVSDLLSNGIINFILNIFNLVFIAVFMFLINVQLTLVVLAGLPVFIAVLFSIKPSQRRAWQGFSNKSSNLNAYLHENINGIRVTQAFTREPVNEGIFTRLSREVRDTWMKAIYVTYLVPFSVDNISQIIFSFIYVLGIYGVVGTAASFGTILAMSSYASRFWQPINDLANLYNNFINTIAYLERIFETMDEPATVADEPDAKPLPPICGNVEFRGVGFEYEPGVRVLDNVSFTARPGESIALVGPTGAGKSTIVNLVSRFYNLKDGELLIDGTDIRGATLDSLRRQMGIMLQDSFIFSGTILDNIRYGRLDATDEEVVRAAKAVRADDFIREMENGYQTEVNERGSRLSQGQKQLIAFARTLLSDPAILILDEATSSIDTRTERLLQEGLLELLRGRTSFIIAHRLSTVKNCDRILYVDSGRIIESGSHEDLLRRRGAYYDLYCSQMSG